MKQDENILNPITENTNDIRLHKEPFVIKSVFGKKGFLLLAKELDVFG